jgi:hypothetical protein
LGEHQPGIGATGDLKSAGKKDPKLHRIFSCIQGAANGAHIRIFTVAATPKAGK